MELDALVASGADRGERYETGQLDPAPRAVVRTARRRGRRLGDRDASGSWDAVPLPGRSATPTAAATASRPGSPTGSAPAWRCQEALELGARCGAACLTGRGPYAGQLTSA